jgi:hypothetical protein
VHRGFAHFRALMQSQHQFDFLHWRASVAHWRTVAAAVWFACASLAVLGVFSLSYTSVWPGPRGWGWGWAISFEHNALRAHWYAALLFVAAQVVLLLLRAHSRRTDPSPLFQPLVVRVWRALTQGRLLGLVACSFLAMLFAGYMAADVLFASSTVWHGKAALAAQNASAGIGKQPPAAAAEPVTAASAEAAYTLVAEQSLVVFGLLCYSAWRSLAYMVRLETLLTFPLLRHQARRRILADVSAGLLLRAVHSAVKFAALFALLVWSWLGRMVVTLPAVTPSGDANIDEASAAFHAAAAANHSFLSLANLAPLYHLFLLVLVLEYCTLLCRAFLSVFLTQPLSFHSFFLHALFEQRRNPASSSLGFNDEDEAMMNFAAQQDGDGVEYDGTAALVPRVGVDSSSADTLTGHLVLQYLLDLASSPAPGMDTLRNTALFQSDMNALFGAAASLQQNGAASAAGLPALRSTLPRQPAFVPVLLYCMHHLRMLSDSLALQRTLAQHAPSAMRDGPNGSGAMVAAGSGGGGGFNPYASAQPLASTSPALAWAAFVAVRLDGAGLLFPCKAQLSAQLLAQRRLHMLCVELLTSLALHAQGELRGAQDSAAALDADGQQQALLFPRGSLTAGAHAASLSARPAAALFVRQWSGAVLSLLASLSLSLDSFSHASHSLSAAQEQSLQGHQLSRSDVVAMDAALERCMHALANAYADELQEGRWSFAPQIAAKLQAYTSPHK